MARAYTSPGVRVVETPNPTLVSGVPTLSRVALVGVGQGFENATERLILSGTTAITFANKGLDLTQALNADVTTPLRSPLVKYAADSTVVNPGSYLIVQSLDPDSTVTGDESYTIARIPDPLTAPSVATGTGALTGSYTYAVSFFNTRGETGIGPASTPITLTAQGANLTNIPLAPAQTGVTWSGRNIYRMKSVATGGDGLFHLVATINDNTTTLINNEAAADSTSTSNNPKTGMASGTTVLVSYKFTDNFYYEPTLFSSFDDISDQYGAPFASDGSISSTLTFAARIAMSNGADEIIIAAATANNATAFSTALDKLRNDDTIAFVVPISGDTAVHTLVAAHIALMNTQGFYRQGIIGQDGSASSILATTLRSAAAGYNAEYMNLMSPASFGYINGVSGQEMAIGGQYMAAAYAGMAAARDAQIPLTRKPVGGFSSVRDKRTESEKQQDSSSGLAVIESKGGVIRVRHSVSTAPGSPNTGEFSVVRAKYEMARRIYDSLDRNVIGIVAPLDETPLIVQAVVSGVLEQVTSEGMISSWDNISASALNGDPTTIQVSFEYIPAYPVNRVEVRFQINTNTGVLTSLDNTTTNT
jgi:hypothetical protein